MALSREDAVAIAGTAQRLQVDPRTLGALMELESGVNPNIWGGAGGQYRGLIQFGPGARKEVGLPDGPMTIAAQMPYVEKYFKQRGFEPGKHGPTELYRTVLVGNPGQAGTDSFGTNSDTAAKRMRPGGDLYQRFSQKFDPASGPGLEGFSAPQPQAGADRSADPLIATVTAMLAPGGMISRPGGMAMSPDSEAALQAINPGAAAQVDAIKALFPGAPANTAPRIGPEAEPSPSTSPLPGGGTALRVIEYLTGDTGHAGYRADHGGNNYHEHLAFQTKEQRDAAIQKLKAAGIQIGSVNDGVHAPGSYHYQDLAFDVPAAQVPVGQEQTLSRRVRSILGIA